MMKNYIHIKYVYWLNAKVQKLGPLDSCLDISPEQKVLKVPYSTTAWELNKDK